jgi:tRNA A37 threonylcarbamoyladenosine modification protein TsaB
MAWALGIPLYALSSLVAAALAPVTDRDDRLPPLDLLAGPLRPRCVLFDARGERVYGAAYRAAHGRLETLVEPIATTVTRMVDGIIPAGSILLGDGAVRHRDLLTGAGHVVLPAPAGHPSADGLLRRMELMPPPLPLDDPGRWEPEYLRASGAERLWKTRPRGDR